MMDFLIEKEKGTFAGPLPGVSMRKDTLFNLTCSAVGRF